LRRKGQTVMYVLRDRRLIGLLGVADPIKESTREAVPELHRQGLKIVNGDKVEKKIILPTMTIDKSNAAQILKEQGLPVQP